MRDGAVSRWPLGAALFILLAILVLGTSAGAQPPQKQVRTTLVAPPRSIADITELLDKEVPDPAKRAKLEASADAKPKANAGRSELFEFYYARARDRASIGRTLEAIADCELAIANSSDYDKDASRVEQFMEIQVRVSGDVRRALKILERLASKLDIAGRNKGRAFYVHGRLAHNHLLLGDLARAEHFLRKNEALLPEARTWPNVGLYMTQWEANIEEPRAHIAAARGRYQEAEAAFRRAAILYADALQKSRSWPIAYPKLDVCPCGSRNSPAGPIFRSGN
jgi:tetratricopeptide (TPR) repeat protein